MEIITYVRRGAITHRDSNGNLGKTEAGDVQVMSAGTGVFHSEFNLESEDTNIFQIWIEPNRLDVKPRWDSYEFPKDPSSDSLTLLVSGDGKAPLSIYQNASIYAGNFNEGVKLNHLIKNQAYILVSEGSVNIEGCLMSEGDGLEITELSVANIQALSNSKILVIDVPI
jgi:redox-sensitive bicupin YhaK (pirin superfamily)